MKVLKPDDLMKMNDWLYPEAMVKLAYYDKLFLYNNKELILSPNGILGLEPIAILNKKDYYTKKNFEDRKIYFLDNVKGLPYQKAKACGLLARDICHSQMSLEDKLLSGVEFYNGYHMAYIDFTKEPMRWANLKRAKQDIEKREKAKYYDRYYERFSAYVEFYNDLNKYRANKRRKKNG